MPAQEDYRKHRLISELYDKVITCKIVYKQITDPDRFNLDKHLNFDSQTEISKLDFDVRSYISEIWQFYNLICTDTIQRDLKVKLSSNQKNKLDWLRTEVRNNVQHIDERIKEFLDGKHNNPFYCNFLKNGNDFIYEFGGQHVKLKEYHSTKPIPEHLKNDSFTKYHLVDSNIEKDIHKYK